MKGIEIFEKALTLLGYINQEGSFLDSLNLKALNVINTVYADLYFLLHSDGFKPLKSLDDTPLLSNRILLDVMPYGVAMHLAQNMGDGLNQQIFATIYDAKRCSINIIDTRTDCIPGI